MPGTQTPFSSLPANLKQGMFESATIVNRLRKLVGRIKGRGGIKVSVGPDGGLIISGNAAVNCPFKVELLKETENDVDTWKVKIGQGWVTAGTAAKYDYLGTTNVLSTPLTPSTKYLVSFQVAVDVDDGYFTGDYKPHYDNVIPATNIASINTGTECGFVLASFSTDSAGYPDPNTLRQDWWSNIHVLIIRMGDTSSYNYYVCSHLWTVAIDTYNNNYVKNSAYGGLFSNNTAQVVSG